MNCGLRKALARFSQRILARQIHCSLTSSQDELLQINGQVWDITVFGIISQPTADCELYSGNSALSMHTVFDRDLQTRFSGQDADFRQRSKAGLGLSCLRRILYLLGAMAYLRNKVRLDARAPEFSSSNCWEHGPYVNIVSLGSGTCNVMKVVPNLRQESDRKL